MPIPPYVTTVTLLLCERFLREADGVFSAIRIVDVFYVPESPPSTPDERLPVVQFYALAQVKTKPGHNDKHVVWFKLLTTKGELADMGGPVSVGQGSSLFPTAPGGFTVAIQINLRVKNLGTAYLCFYLDSEELIRTPFTLTPTPITPLPQSPEAPLVG